MEILAVVTKPASVRRYLEGTGLPTEAPRVRAARPPPQAQLEEAIAGRDDSFAASAAVTTLAGSPPAGGSTDGAGPAAQFKWPAGMASDGLGNIFVADEWSSTIRKVVIATGAVTTLAGGSAGTGSAARFHSPRGMASDTSGNLFVADSLNYTIRQVVIATGEVTTLAGSPGSPGSTDGTGTSALFTDLTAITADKAGHLFAADGHTIRKIVIATQEVTTVVGSPDRVEVALGPLPAGLSQPAGLAMGPSGELLIADHNENAILAAWF